jgi:transposase InsO family protein
MEERLRFVARLLDCETMSEVCREFGVSRKTGYKIFERYKDHGLEALSDRSRRPIRHANQLPGADRKPDRPLQAGEAALGRPQDPRAAAALARRRFSHSRQEHDPRRLARHGLVKGIGRARHRAEGTPLSQGRAPNDLWCADFKGEFKLGDGRYCDPLTVTDHAARLSLMCEALESTREDLAVTAFEQLFRERGLPSAIRSDNGVPFASPTVCSISRSFPSGGSDSASPSNASSLAISSRTAATSACISRSRRRPRARRA